LSLEGFEKLIIGYVMVDNDRVNEPIIGTHPVIGTVCDNLIFQINSRFLYDAVIDV